VVHAVDIDIHGVDAVSLLQLVLAHPSTHYAILDRRIYSKRNNFMPEPYRGSDPHTSHLHVSILTTHSAEVSRRPWGLTRTASH
jgi:hypothetical protein